MTVFPARIFLCLFLAVVLATAVGLQALAQTTDAMQGAVARDASFLPPDASSTPPATPPIDVPQMAPASSMPAPLVPPTAPVAPAASTFVMPPVAATPPAATPPASAQAPLVITAPVPVSSAAPALVAPPTAMPLTTPATSSVGATPTPAALTVAQPSVSPAAAIVPQPSVPPAKSIDLGKLVETAPLESVDAESIGLISNAEGGLGAAMWKGTSHVSVEQLLPALNLPTPSSALNNLALRFLLTTAAKPAGAAVASQSLLSMRVEKLLALGDARDAWKLTQLAKPELIDEITLRLAAEAALIGDAREDVCGKLPELIKTHNGAEWQKLMLVCQLRAKDQKAAQLTLDLMRTQGVKDDVFFYVAEKNILGGVKQLPRQLTPLKPLTLALLRLADLPLPGEIYTRPDAVMIPELLGAKAHEEVARLGLAERASERGLLNANDLSAVYRSIVFPADALAAAPSTAETGPRLHALLYQAALQDRVPANRVNDALRFMQGSTPAFLKGSAAQLLPAMVDGIDPTQENNALSGSIAHIYVLGGQPEKAMTWLKLAKHAGIGMLPVATELHDIWPLTVFAGLESDTSYVNDLKEWLETTLKQDDPKVDNRAQRELAAEVLLLLDADGFTVTEDQWARVMNAGAFEKHLMPPALLLERLRTTSGASRRGETVLLALLLASGSAADPTLFTTLETIRALRLVGLTGDAGALARETAIGLMAPAK